MELLSGSLKIACVDLTFNWPPVGGCWIDTHHVLKGLQERGAEVSLFVPKFDEYYPRGVIQEELPYPVVRIPFNRYTYHAFNVIKRFRQAVNAFKPDLVLLTDGYFMKNHLLTALGPERCLLRFYSYELLCVNLHYYRYHENRICEYGYFDNPRECHRCWFHRMPMSGRAVQIALGMKEQHPKLHFSQEYIASLAFTKSYHEKLISNLARLRGAIVYNAFMRNQLRPYTNAVHVIASGVDVEKFFPAEGSSAEGDGIKLFMPGRANDPLKGLPPLIEACDQLARDGHAFELHYTAAMDCSVERPWLINRGWVGPEPLPAMYREMDIVVAPSIWIEPFGITALEGMASGLPVVAGSIGGLAETVLHEETGLHVEPGNPNDLYEALKLLIQDAELRRRLGEAGRHRVEAHFNWEGILDFQYVPLIEQAMGPIHGSSAQHSTAAQPELSS